MQARLRYKCVDFLGMANGRFRKTLPSYTHLHLHSTHLACHIPYLLYNSVYDMLKMTMSAITIVNVGDTLPEYTLHYVKVDGNIHEWTEGQTDTSTLRIDK